MRPCVNGWVTYTRIYSLWCRSLQPMTFGYYKVPKKFLASIKELIRKVGISFVLERMLRRHWMIRGWARILYWWLWEWLLDGSSISGKVINYLTAARETDQFLLGLWLNWAQDPFSPLFCCKTVFSLYRQPWTSASRSMLLSVISSVLCIQKCRPFWLVWAHSSWNI